MLWFLYALITAISVATLDMLCKRVMGELDEYLVSLIRWGYSLPFLLLFLPFIEIPKLGPNFWLSVVILIPLEIVAIILYMRSIRISPLSLTIPFQALTPVFLILTSFLMLKESPDLSGFIGIILVSLGAYLLNFHRIDQGVWEPIKAIGREKGSLLMIAVAFIYSINSNLGKVAVLSSTPVFFGVIYFFILTGALLPVVFLRLRGNIVGVFSRPGSFLLIGLFSAMMIIFHCLSIELIEVAYMISVKRTSVLFSVIYGGLIFKEFNIRERFIGSAVMVIGVVLITL